MNEESMLLEGAASARLRGAPTLEEMLAELSRRGKVMLGQYGRDDDGWSCTVHMHVSSAGAAFQVKSGYDHPTATSAVQACIDRARSAIRDMTIAPEGKAVRCG